MAAGEGRSKRQQLLTAAVFGGINSVVAIPAMISFTAIIYQVLTGSSTHLFFRRLSSLSTCVIEGGVYVGGAMCVCLGGEGFVCVLVWEKLLSKFACAFAWAVCCSKTPSITRMCLHGSPDPLEDTFFSKHSLLHTLAIQPRMTASTIVSSSRKFFPALVVVNRRAQHEQV